MKIKFEKLPSKHHAQSIDNKILWEQAMIQGIEENNFEEFILKQMNMPISNNSYFYKSSKSKVTKSNTFNQAIMEVIDEER